MNVESTVKAIKAVIGDGLMPLHDPFISNEDVDRVRRAAASEPVGYGFIAQLQDAVAERCHRKYAIAVSSGTAALHLALIVAGVKRGDRVMVPSLTFAGVAAAVKYCDASPVFYDYHNMPMEGVGSAARIMGDILGWPEALAQEPSRRKVDIEDAAAALGSSYKRQPAGSAGLISTLSFNHNKIVAGSGGGMVLTDDVGVADQVRHLATTARMIPGDHFYEHDAVGFNYRMSNLSAALALGQVFRLDGIIERKQALADRYERTLGGLYWTPMGERSVYWNGWLNAIQLRDREERDAVMFALKDAGIQSRALYHPLHWQAPYRGEPAAGAQAVGWWEKTVLLPSGKSACR